MIVTLKIRKHGKSLCLTVPREIWEHLCAGKGDNGLRHN
jgi:hypothetical protein